MQLLLPPTLSKLCQPLFCRGEGQLALEHVNVFSGGGQKVMLSVQTIDLTWHFILFLLVDGASEGISEGNCSKEHFNADDKVLPACGHGASSNFCSIDDERIGYDAAAFQDCQDHSFKAETFSSAIYIFVY